MRSEASMFGAVHASQVATGSKRKSDTLIAPSEEDVLAEEIERKHKLSKISETSSVHEGLAIEEPIPVANVTEPLVGDGSEGMINKLKKTVEGFSARAGKSMGKSLGGAAATALAEARAAAEARIAERNGITSSKPEPVKPVEATIQTFVQTTKETFACFHSCASTSPIWTTF